MVPFGRILLSSVMLLPMVGCGREMGGTKGKHASEFFADRKVAGLAEDLRRGDLTKANLALRYGVDVNTIGKDGMTLLIWSMWMKNKSSFKWLLDNGANPNLVSMDGKAATHLAAAADDPDWLEGLLAQHKADVNLKGTTCNGTVTTSAGTSSFGITITPLSEAITNSRRKNVKLLIKAGADINFRMPESEGASTPAIDAAGVGWNEGVYILLEAGADYRPRTTGGWDVTDEVVRRSINDGPEWREKVLELLKRRGADVPAAQERAQKKQLQDRKERPWMYNK